jgi:hypothetical protein
MSVLFANAALLPLLALVLAPLLVHLLSRTRPPVFWFSSVEFIRRILRRTQRLRRPQDWVLWLLRTLAVLALALAFLRPLLFARSGLGGIGVARHVVVIVDASASMAYIEGARSRFAAACAEANEILAGLTAADTANVIWLRSPPEAVFPEPGVNVQFLREALRKGAVTSEPADVPEAVRLALDMLREREGRKEICLVSDFQRTNWEGVRIEAPPDVNVLSVRVGQGDGENQALTRLFTDPPAPLAGEACSLHCEVRNFSPRQRRFPVLLEAGEARDRQDVSLGPWEKGLAIFPLAPAPAGRRSVVVRLGDDAFPGDNERAAIVEVHPFLQVGLWGVEPETAAAWRRALDALSWVRVETIDSPDTDADVLLLAGWDGGSVEPVLDRLKRGKSVLWFPARETPMSKVAQMLSRDPGTAADGVLGWETSRDPHTLRITRPEDPLFGIFGRGEYGDPARGVFHGRFRLPAAPSTETATLLTYEDGVPALVWTTGSGTLVLWNLALQADASDYATRPEFLPLLAETILRSRPASDEAAERRNAVPGQILVCSLGRTLLPSDVRLTDGGGRSFVVEQHVEGGSFSLASERIRETGVYEWRAGEESVELNAVNFPAAESDLRAGEPATFVGESHAFGGGGEVKAAHAGRPLWAQCLAAAIMFLLMEAALTLWAVRA